MVAGPGFRKRRFPDGRDSTRLARLRTLAARPRDRGKPTTMTNTSTTTPLRWGIIGCARITRRGLIPGIQQSRSGTLQALASRDGALARAWAAEFGVPDSYGSYEELLADPAIDAVYVPLPNELHRPFVIAAADAGKHVLCEKPLALNAGEAEEMVAHCRRRGVVLMEAFMWRHQPRTAEIRRLVAEGAIGELRLVRSSFSFPIEPGDWRLDRERGGGALWDVGCYGLSAARLFSGEEPSAIKALSRNGPTGVDLTLTATLGFPSGVLAVIDCSFEQPFRCVYELVGTKGAIEAPLAYLPPASPTARLIAPDGSLVRELSFDGRSQYAAMVDAFARAVANGGALPDPAEDGLAQMRGLDAILAAARG
jgi:xylose dehydrogenase (NAD/NADP)